MNTKNETMPELIIIIAFLCGKDLREDGTTLFAARQLYLQTPNKKNFTRILDGLGISAQTRKSLSDDLYKASPLVDTILKMQKYSLLKGAPRYTGSGCTLHLKVLTMTAKVLDSTGTT